jgi:hypothetical protein
VAVPSLYLNKTPPSPAWLSPAFSIVKSAGLNQNPDWPILDVNPSAPSTEFQRLQAVAGNDPGAGMANAVRVQLWALAFATGTASGLYLASMGGTKGSTIPAGGAAPISIGPGQEQPFSRPWDKTHGLTSTDPDITSHFVNNEVHCCIYGNVYHASDAASAAIPDVATGPGPLLDVAGNRHHAQRNMTIKLHGTARKMGFHMFAANPDPERDQVFTLQIAERPPRKLPEWQLDELDALGPWIRRTPEAPGEGVPGIEIVIDDERYAVGIAHERLEDLEMGIKGEGGGREVKIELGADEARPMELNATIPDERFVLRIIDLAQTQGDTVVGGARIMLMTVPDELLEPPKEPE